MKSTDEITCREKIILIFHVYTQSSRLTRDNTCEIPNRTSTIDKKFQFSSLQYWNLHNLFLQLKSYSCSYQCNVRIYYNGNIYGILLVLSEQRLRRLPYQDCLMATFNM